MESADFVFSRCREAFFGEVIASSDYWIKENKIPIGILAPNKYDDYPVGSDGLRVIPVRDILSIPIESIDGKNFTNRNLFNLLLLGASGDGKSTQLKNIWFFLQKMGFRVCYIDAAKKDEAARAICKTRFKHNLPPFSKPESIPLTAFVPSFVCKEYEDDEGEISHLKKYGFRLGDLVYPEHWLSLGFPFGAADFISRKIDEYNKSGREISLGDIETELAIGEDLGEIHSLTKGSASRLLAGLRYQKLFSGEPLDLMKEWESKNSVVIGYDDIEAKRFMVFDTGFLIRKASTFASKYKTRIPMFFIFGDAFHYIQRKLENVESNMAISELGRLGRNYRAKGLNSILELQDFDGVSSGILNTYKAFIVSGLFRDIKGLSDVLGKNSDAVLWLSDPEFYGISRDTDNHDVTWIYVNRDGFCVRYTPFLPVCNHFFNPFTNDDNFDGEADE